MFVIEEIVSLLLLVYVLWQGFVEEFIFFNNHSIKMFKSIVVLNEEKQIPISILILNISLFFFITNELDIHQSQIRKRERKSFY